MRNWPRSSCQWRANKATADSAAKIQRAERSATDASDPTAQSWDRRIRGVGARHVIGLVQHAQLSPKLRDLIVEGVVRPRGRHSDVLMLN
eukprot:5122941-Prymnesium_polylepis.3